jgi:ribonuclease Y
MEYVTIVVVSAALAIVLTFLLNRFQAQRANQEAKAAREIADRILAEARTEAEAVRREAQAQARESIGQAKAEFELAKAEFEREAREVRKEYQQGERRLASREEALDRREVDLKRQEQTVAEQSERRESDLRRREQSLTDREQAVESRKEEYDRLLDATRARLEQVAGLTRDEARRNLIESMVEEARSEAAKRIRVVEQEAKEEADRKAKKIIGIAIERLAGEFVAERTVSVVHLPSDDMKGRIIGREGRNIRAIEAATGVDLIIDDTPEAVVVSCFNPIRREIARLALERLISDGRIHPGRIEEVVRKAEEQVEESVREAGQKAVLELGIHGIHPELVRLVGMLKYRYSYAQNVLMHSMECAYICGAMAAELGLNEKLARRAGLLHDIGKALTHEVEGSHAIIGGDIARKYGESAKVVNAIAAHHEEVKAETILAPLVDAADALSGARPGARREMLESYVRRLEDLERISNSFKGVEKSFAVQAGREIRIIVEPRSVSDDQAATLAQEVARKIESEMTYPGQIKVTVIRETRASEFAR